MEKNKHLLVFKSNHNSIVVKICDNCLWVRKRTKLKPLVKCWIWHFFVLLFWFLFSFRFVFLLLLSSFHYSISVGFQSSHIPIFTEQHSTEKVNCKQIEPIFVIHFMNWNVNWMKFSPRIWKSATFLMSGTFFFLKWMLRTQQFFHFSFLDSVDFSIFICQKLSSDVHFNEDTICFLCLVILPFGH